MVEREARRRRAALHEDPVLVGPFLGVEHVVERRRDVRLLREVAPGDLAVLHEVLRVALDGLEEGVVVAVAEQPEPAFEQDEEEDGDQQHRPGE